MTVRLISKVFICTIIFLITIDARAASVIDFSRLKESYPDTIKDVSSQYITWKDGTRMRLYSSQSFMGRLGMMFHKTQKNETSLSIEDLQCHGVEPFLKKMYGGNQREVKQNLVTIYWMPKAFGNRYPLKVTTVNGIDKKIKRISAALEKLPASNYKYLANPAGSFYWRKVKYEKYLSSHSFGIAMDINSRHANYWMWDWEKAHKPRGRMMLHNTVPKEIVDIFEREGFLWGGRWYFYDTMHFEYRPEFFIKESASRLRYNSGLSLNCYG